MIQWSFYVLFLHSFGPLPGSVECLDCLVFLVQPKCWLWAVRQWHEASVLPSWMFHFISTSGMQNHEMVVEGIEIVLFCLVAYSCWLFKLHSCSDELSLSSKPLKKTCWEAEWKLWIWVEFCTYDSCWWRLCFGCAVFGQIQGLGFLRIAPFGFKQLCLCAALSFLYPNSLMFYWRHTLWCMKT